MSCVAWASEGSRDSALGSLAKRPSVSSGRRGSLDCTAEAQWQVFRDSLLRLYMFYKDMEEAPSKSSAVITDLESIAAAIRRRVWGLSIGEKGDLTTSPCKGARILCARVPCCDDQPICFCPPVRHSRADPRVSLPGCKPGIDAAVDCLAGTLVSSPHRSMERASEACHRSAVTRKWQHS